MNEFLKNLRSSQKDRSQGAGRSSQESYGNQERRAAYDRRSQQKKSTAQVGEDFFKRTEEILVGIHMLLQGMNETMGRLADARERSADVEDRKLALLEAMLPLTLDALKVVAEGWSPAVMSPGNQEKEGGPPEQEREAPVLKKLSGEEKKEIIKKIRSLREQGYTYDQIAEYLENNRVPTFSNKGKWHAQTIHRLCRIP
ncbi:recombinase [Desulfobotulus alkaliphilus]|uniref:Recombinase n=1 Tax=Desulfobotulus alkaliphilus TaxID=622671 RepID=A0A562RT35_9BACT|nr:recombinase family protein [Desulfobotulus alkaliphilus]TWI72245.1 recombinase [Desulfobotulus alkaliphilus]